MSGHNRWAIIGLVLLSAAMGWNCSAADNTAANADNGKAVGLFRAMSDGQVDAKFIAFNDRAARLIITNKLKQPIHLQLPEAFAGVPVLAQLGGGGRGGGGFGGGGGGRGGGGGGQQSVGGGGGGLGGGGQGGGGGGFFSIPPEQTAKINVPVVCLDHGLQNPSSSNPYKIVPAEDHLDRPAVIELLKAFGRGELQHGATQAAAWHLNSDVGWPELTAKLQGTRRSLRRPPYFNREEIQAGMAYATEAGRLAEANATQYRRIYEEKEQREKEASEAASSSESLSTSDSDSVEPTPTE